MNLNKTGFVNLTALLRNSELNLVFPITDNASLVILPYVDQKNSEDIKTYILQTLETADIIASQRNLLIASIYYPVDSELASELFDSLKQNIEQERSL